MSGWLSGMEHSDWISIVALFVAMLAFGISLYEILNNKPKLRVSLKNAVVTSRGAITATKGKIKGATHLVVAITNIGRQPTTINSIYFKTKEAKNNFYANVDRSISDAFGKLLHPGEVINFRIPGDLDTVAINSVVVNLFGLVNDHNGWVCVDHSWSNNPNKARVKS